MSKKVVLKFPEKMLGNGDQMRLTITFDTNIAGSQVETLNSDTEGIYISDYGTGDWEFDLEKFLLVPGIYELKLAALTDNYPITNNKIEQFFFEDAQVKKDAEVHLEIKFNGSPNWETEFIGNVIPKLSKSNPDRSELFITAAPNLNILNRELLFDITNPNNPVSKNPLGYSQNTFVYLINIISDIYKKISPSITTVFKHNWKWYAFWQSMDNTEFYEAFDIPFDKIKHYVNPLFFEYTGINTLGDLLKKFAFDWGCYTGLMTGNKAFFIQLFNYDPASVYDLSDDSYYKHEKRYEYTPVKMAAITATQPGRPSANVYAEGTRSGLEEENLEKQTNTDISFISSNPIIYEYYHVRYEDHPIPVSFLVTAAKDTLLSNNYNLSHMQLLAKFWYNYRSNIHKCRGDIIVAPGLNHSMIKFPRLRGIIHQPLRIKKKYYECKTEITGIPVG